LLAKFQT